MKRKTAIPVVLAAGLFLLGACSPISPQLRNTAEADVPFSTLVSELESYKGKTILLGGKVLALRQESDRTLLTVQQCPLNHEGRPHCKTDSAGIFLVASKGRPIGHSDPPDEEITVVGRIIGHEKDEGSYCGSGCLMIEALEVHVWPMMPPPDLKLWPRYPFDRGARSWEGF